MKNEGLIGQCIWALTAKPEMGPDFSAQELLLLQLLLRVLLCQYLFAIFASTRVVFYFICFYGFSRASNALQAHVYTRICVCVCVCQIKVSRVLPCAYTTYVYALYRVSSHLPYGL